MVAERSHEEIISEIYRACNGKYPLLGNGVRRFSEITAETNRIVFILIRRVMMFSRKKTAIARQRARMVCDLQAIITQVKIAAEFE